MSKFLHFLANSSCENKKNVVILQRICKVHFTINSNINQF